MPDPATTQPDFYVHDLDPIIFHLVGGIAPRWYGLAYVLGFFLGILVLRWLARRDRFVLAPDKVSDFLTYAFIFGVFLGGRAGYFLFYKPATLLSDPLEFFNLLGGGMASHGGILGLIAFTFYYARRHKVSWPAVGDGLVVVAPIGLALGRIANFINGELYGRITTSTKWAVIFPDSLREPNSLGDHTSEAWNAIIDAEPRIDLTTPDRISQVVTYVRDNPELKTVLATYLAPRHPSQLYEALFEGILLFAVLFAIRCYYKKLAPGILTGLFFVLYAVARIFVEHYREPDAELILDLTRGQFYSTFMIVIGIAFITYGFVAKKKPPPPTPEHSMRLLITIAAFLAAALPDAAAAVPLHVTPLNGASGRAATRTLVADLVTSGVFELLKSPEPRAFKITGSSTGGRIDASFSSPGSKLVFARTYNGPGIKTNAHRFADDVVHHVTGKPGIASANISFVSDKSGSRQIYLCDADGTAVRQITSDPSPCISPCLSPDGSYLTFTSFRSGYPDIDFIDLLTGSRQRIVDSAGTNAGTAIAPDGRRIALTKSLTGNPDLYISHIGSGRTSRLTRTDAIESAPAWSPDGHELVFTSFASGSQPTLFRIRSSGGKPERVPTARAHSDAADWSPDGTRIAFEFLDSAQQSQIAVLDLGSGKVKTIAPGTSPAWAPDSRHLAYTQTGDLILHDVRSGATSTLVTTDGYLADPSWTR